MQIKWTQTNIKLPYCNPLTILTAQIGEYFYNIGVKCPSDAVLAQQEIDQGKVTLTEYIRQHLKDDNGEVRL